MTEKDMKAMIDIFDKAINDSFGLPRKVVERSSIACTATEVLSQQEKILEIIGWMPVRFR